MPTGVATAIVASRTYPKPVDSPGFPQFSANIPEHWRKPGELDCGVAVGLPRRWAATRRIGLWGGCRVAPALGGYPEALPVARGGT